LIVCGLAIECEAANNGNGNAVGNAGGRNGQGGNIPDYNQTAIPEGGGPVEEYDTPDDYPDDAYQLRLVGTSGEITISPPVGNPDTTYARIRLGRLREVAPDGTPQATFVLFGSRWARWFRTDNVFLNGVNVTRFTWLGKVSVTQRNANITIVIFKVPRLIETLNGNQTVIVTQFQLKFTVSIFAFPFKANNSKLILELVLDNEGGRQANYTSGLTGDNSYNKDQKIFGVMGLDWGLGRLALPNNAVADGVDTLVTFEFLNRDAEGVIGVNVIFPFFQKTMVWDPVLGTDPQESQLNAALTHSHASPLILLACIAATLFAINKL
jgi:hypothetical protein